MMQQFLKHWAVRRIAQLMVFSMVFIRVTPPGIFASPPPLPALNRGLKPGQYQALPPALLKKVEARQKRAGRIPDVRSLSQNEMKQIFGRGVYRNKYLAGTLPWQRSLRDVNLCSGNLFKSFTDIQVAPAKGAGLALQRTYNSDDDRIGPFGVGWTHAYDIRMEEEDAGDSTGTSGGTTGSTTGTTSSTTGYPGTSTGSTGYPGTSTTGSTGYPGTSSTGSTASTTGSSTGTPDMVDRTDFFGGKHRYHRDADGLYTPPVYLYDQLNSDYEDQLVNGPSVVTADTETGEDGTIKHYIANGNERDCDYIQDRHGNRTTTHAAAPLHTYGTYHCVPSPDGSS